MAFDGITLAALTSEFRSELIGGTVQKIAQPEKDELLLTIKNNRTVYRLKISASPSLPLVCLTDTNKQSPLTAPNFCMILRKHLSGARILEISQIALERVLAITLENRNELGDMVQRKLMIEIMGKHSNIIFVNENNVIIDSIKHISGMVSSVREVLPGRDYFIPNTLHKLDPLTATTEDWHNTIFEKPMPVAKAIYTSLSGFSSTMAHELAYQCRIDGDAPTASLNGNDKAALLSQFRVLVDQIKNSDFHPSLYLDGSMPKEFAACPLTMYNTLTCYTDPSMSHIIERFYSEKDTLGRIRQKSSDIRKSITTHLDRCYKKMDLQRKQLKDTEKKEKFKVYGELLTTYGYQLGADDTELTCINYYDDKEIKIPVDNTLSSIENANKYFDKYNKMKRTYEAVSQQMEQNQKAIEHLESILTELDIARKEEDLHFIRQELFEAGYIKKLDKNGKGKNKRIKSTPLHFLSSDGYDIYVGKNNFQNDELTFRFATGNDWWFHAKQMPGSHVIVKTQEGEPPISTFEQAAALAAHFSKGKNSEKLEIDYTQKKHVKKPNGGNPGFVIYHTNYSMIANMASLKQVQCIHEEDKIFLEGSGL